MNKATPTPRTDLEQALHEGMIDRMQIISKQAATIVQLLEVLSMVQTELVTLAPRLYGPYRANITICIDLIRVALKVQP